MKVPVSWLKAYVDFDDSIQGLADKLTFSGVEVEGIETIGGEFPGVVVGEVLAVERHPNADRLTLCRVTDGTTEWQVVCGAPNVAAGMKAPFAPVGTTLPNGLTLKKAKIRQVESFGMLLAEDELGLSDDHAGLMVLDAKWTPGTPLVDVLGPPETVLDLEITPNRPDCLSLIGLAREVATLYGTTLKKPDVALPAGGAKLADLVEVQDVQACPRYTARILSGITIGPSPEWMQRRLSAAGIRPINNVVDITNYVMLETGHPLHAFDQDLLAGGRVQVRRALAGEKMLTLDGIERALTPEMLVIADAEKPVAVAGVMGGAGSEIRDETTRVLLESACFDPLLTRGTSRNLGLSTESSYRFERGVDADTVEWASQRAAALLIELAGGTLEGDVIDVYPEPVTPHAVSCEWAFVRKLTGLTISDADIESILSGLELTFTAKDDVRFTVAIPTFRRDLERSVDLVEEVARIHGLDQIPVLPPHAELVPDADYRSHAAKALLRERCAALGLREIMNYSLTAPALLDLFDRDDGEKRVTLPNPISAEQSVLRTSLIPQMVETLGRNHARQIPEALFFELGRVWERCDGAIKESERLSFGLLGPVGRDAYAKRKPIEASEMFTWMKGVLQALFTAQGLTGVEAVAADHAYLEKCQAVAWVLDGQKIGVMGCLRGDLRKEWRMTDPVALAELDVVALLAQARRLPKAQPVPQYPAIVRDMALVVDAGVRHADVLAVVQKSAPKEFENIELFDIFTSDTLGAGKKSMAYSVTYRSDTRTLTDEEANGYHERVKDAIKSELNVVIREQ